MVDLARTADWSDVGAVRVLNAAGEEVGLQRGVSVLPPLAARTVRIPVDPALGAPARVVYEREDDADAAPLASADIL